MQMAAEYELVCVQQTCGSPEKIGEITSGNGARRVGFRESDDDWFAWGDECKRIADEGCEADDRSWWGHASSAGVGGYPRQVDQAAGGWVTMKSHSQLFMRAEGLMVAKSKFTHVRDD